MRDGALSSTHLYSMMGNSLAGKINNKVGCDFLNFNIRCRSNTDRVYQVVSIQVNLLKTCIHLTPFCKRSRSRPGSESQRLKIKTAGEKMDRERLAAKPALPAEIIRVPASQTAEDILFFCVWAELDQHSSQAVDRALQ